MTRRAASRAVMQPQSCKPQCAPELIRGGPVHAVTHAARLRLAAASLLRRVGLSGPADALARRGGVKSALLAGLRMLGVPTGSLV